MFDFFLFPFFKMCIILAFYHAVGFRSSDNHLFNVSMVVAGCSPFFIYQGAASTSHDVISVYYGTLFTVV